MEWKPIETAPKDGTDILAFWPCSDVEGEFEVHSIRAYSGEIHNANWEFTGGICITFVDKGDEPTHWMPLPDPPE